jgi:catechol 2,3-dioxygenase-like lactoylglutathione lyase family enzyme
MPKRATLGERVRWHVAHASACGCRPMPRTIREALQTRAGGIRTHGLTHLSLSVKDPRRSLRFYTRVFGVKPYYRDRDQIQVLGPGPHDVLAFERDAEKAGRQGGIGHFGFRLVDPADIDRAVEAALAAGGTLLRRGAFGPGLPFAYVADPDGYEIEIWYEGTKPFAATRS